MSKSPATPDEVRIFNHYGLKIPTTDYARTNTIDFIFGKDLGHDPKNENAISERVELLRYTDQFWGKTVHYKGKEVKVTFIAARLNPGVISVSYQSPLVAMVNNNIIDATRLDPLAHLAPKVKVRRKLRVNNYSVSKPVIVT